MARTPHFWFPQYFAIAAIASFFGLVVACFMLWYYRSNLPKCIREYTTYYTIMALAFGECLDSDYQKYLRSERNSGVAVLSSICFAIYTVCFYFAWLAVRKKYG